MRNAIGIDPDSNGFVCCYVKRAVEKVKTKNYPMLSSALEKFTKWVKTQGDVIIAIEGINGQSNPIEKVLREAGITFYSFKPSSVADYRKAVLGSNKNNEKDAESVARYALSMADQGKLNEYKQAWEPDEELRILTRSYERKTKLLTSEINNLWKQIKIASSDLYLALKGKNEELDITSNIITNKGILYLLSSKPDITEWQRMSKDDFIVTMNGNYNGRTKIILSIMKIVSKFRKLSKNTELSIKHAADLILILQEQQKGIRDQLIEISENKPMVKKLMEIKGIGIITASTMNAEIITIGRFRKEDNLASYSGLGRRQDNTGDKNKKMKHQVMYNRRLKDAFMTAAKNYVIFNRDSHLTGYYRNLIKAGMRKIEANKRVSRALVRVIFKMCSQNENK